MLYSLFVMIGDGKGSFWCGIEGKYMSSDPTSRARAGPGEEEEEEKSSATRFELGGPKGALRFDETTPSPVVAEPQPLREAQPQEAQLSRAACAACSIVLEQ